MSLLYGKLPAMRLWYGLVIPLSVADTLLYIAKSSA
jgi:hypothetical protein